MATRFLLEIATGNKSNLLYPDSIVPNRNGVGYDVHSVGSRHLATFSVGRGWDAEAENDCEGRYIQQRECSGGSGYTKCAGGLVNG